MRRTGLGPRLFALVALGVVLTQAITVTFFVFEFRRFQSRSFAVQADAVAALEESFSRMVRETTMSGARTGEEILRDASLELFESIKRSTEGSLERGEMEKFVRTARRMQEAGGVTEFNLLDAAGRITHSTAPAAVGAPMPPPARRRLERAGDRVLFRTGKRLHIYEAVRAESGDCLRCHPTWHIGQRVGFLHMAYQDDRLNRWSTATSAWGSEVQRGFQSARFRLRETLEEQARNSARGALWASLAVLGGASALLFVGLRWLLARQVVVPVEALARSARCLARGDPPPADLPVRERGEIGYLAREFRHMAETLHEREEALQASIRTIEANRRELEAFAHSVSHDLKAPLGTISAFAELTLADADLGERNREAVQWIHWNARRLAAFVESILQLAQAGQSAGSRSRFPLSEVLDHAASLHRASMESSGATLEVEGGDVELVGHRDLYLRVFSNLLANSLAHAGDTPEAPRIRVEARRNDAWLDVRFRDNGPGIPPEARATLFEPYAKGLSSRGSGLGLAIVHRALVSLGGEIGIEDGRPQGVCFILRFPPEPNECLA